MARTTATLPPGSRIGYPMGNFGPVGRGKLSDFVYQDRRGQPYITE